MEMLTVKIVLLLLIIFWQSQLTVFADEVIVETKKTNFLEGRVEHSDQLPPLEPNLKVGATFNIAKLKKLTPNNRWYKLPNWIVGTWKTEYQTNYYKYNYNSRSESFDIDTFGYRGAETLGHQKDRLGEIWQYTGSAYWTIADLDYSIALDYVQEHECIRSEPNKLVIRYAAIACQISKLDHSIIYINQRESIQTYTPDGPNLMKCISSLKIFDRDGSPEYLAETLSFKRRRSSFETCNDYDGKNLRILFAEYLRNNNLAHRIPTALANYSKTRITGKK